jgi:hypothetical protein
MRNTHPTSHFSSSIRGPAHAGAIEWEELPSLADSLADRLIIHGTRARESTGGAPSRRFAFGPAANSGAAWDTTRPAAFDAAAQPQPFREALNGLAIREVTEPEVFRHFFGTS